MTFSLVELIDSARAGLTSCCPMSLNLDSLIVIIAVGETLVKSTKEQLFAP